MDLVEIRKKAKRSKKKPAKKPAVKIAAESPDSPPVIEEPAEAPADDAAVAPEPVKDVVSEVQQVLTNEPEKGEPDPLDVLFSFRSDGALATEKSYLNALIDDDAEVDIDQQQWLTFSLGDEEYALELEVVNEIIKPRDVTDIPRVPGFIRGIISLRGIIVPVFDLRGRLNIGTVEPGSTTRIVVCQQDEKLAGLLVDSINQVVTIPSSRIEPPPTVLSGLDRDFVEGVGRIDGRMLILLHLTNVINVEMV